MAKTATLCFIWLRPSYGLFYPCQIRRLPELASMPQDRADMCDCLVDGDPQSCRMPDQIRAER